MGHHTKCLSTGVQFTSGVAPGEIRRKGLVKSCMRAMENNEYCNCVANAIKKHVPVEHENHHQRALRFSTWLNLCNMQAGHLRLRICRNRRKATESVYDIDDRPSLSVLTQWPNKIGLMDSELPCWVTGVVTSARC